MDFHTLAKVTSQSISLFSSSSSQHRRRLDDEESSSSSLPAGDYDINNGTEKPFLSPTAEAELLLLATNFLLYVAMVIITTIVAKIYFPESLERGDVSNVSRTVSYRRVEENEQEEEEEEFDDDDEDDDEDEEGEYYGSDCEYDDDDEDEEEENVVEMMEEEESQQGVMMGGFDENEMENGRMPLLEMESSKDDDDDKKKKKSRRKRLRRLRSGGGNSNFLEFETSVTSKAIVLRRLALCTFMLNATFITWGLLQERMLTRRYPRLTGEYFTYSYFLVFTNRSWTLIMSGLLMLYLKPRRSHSTVIYEYSFPSISNLLSSWCQYEALQYVSFPAVTLFKSFKLAPVMAMGKMLGNKEYPQYDYIVALFIGLGIAMFMSSTDDLQFTTNATGTIIGTKTLTGILLLSLFLLFDSFTSQWQSRMFQRHRDLSMIELMFATSAFSTVLSFITLVHTNELSPAMEFVVRHSEIHYHFFTFSICSTIGQLFIFYTIKNFGAVVFTIIMTTRVLLSIALSVGLYGHEVSGNGFLGLCLVMMAVCYRIKRKAEGKHLIKWEGILGDEKASELVQEWHEHIDT